MSTIPPFKYGLALFAVLTLTRAFAHDPSQITYDFNEAGQLNIHLTPKGAFDVLQSIRPDLASASVIRLSIGGDTDAPSKLMIPAMPHIL